MPLPAVFLHIIPLTQTSPSACVSVYAMCACSILVESHLPVHVRNKPEERHPRKCADTLTLTHRPKDLADPSPKK